MHRLLVVEDDETIGAALESSLQTQGYHVRWVQSGHEGVAAASDGAYDLVLLDLGLPDLDGVEVCRRIRRAQVSCVLVMLTARTDEMDVVVGLEAGADDYLTKPFRMTELLARVRAHLRRAATPDAPKILQLGDLVVDPAARTVQLAGTDFPLRAKEFDLLARLAAEPGVALSRETLMADVWDENWFGSTKTLDVHVAAIRSKLASVAVGSPLRVPRIVTLRGHGYRIEAAG
jgi:DNA-binding response OmpR family regulator